MTILVLAAIPAVVEAGIMGALVPAYFYPGSGGPGGSGDGWAAMTAAAGQIPVTAIFNPNSGPAGAVDTNYQTAITNLENAGGKVIAYIPTGYGVTSLATVEAAANTYLSQYGSHIEGFFIDEMTNSNNAGDLAYYHTLYSDLKSINPAFDIIGNPGSPTQPGYLTPATQGADTLVTYENNDQTYPYTSTTPSSWTSGFPAADFANIIYNQPTAAGMIADVNAAASNNVGLVYVTDQTVPNPYRQLPAYWEQEVGALKSASTPEPTAILLWSMAALSAGVWRTAGRFQRGRTPRA